MRDERFLVKDMDLNSAELLEKLGRYKKLCEDMITKANRYTKWARSLKFDSALIAKVFDFTTLFEMDKYVDFLYDFHTNLSAFEADLSSFNEKTFDEIDFPFMQSQFNH